MKAASRKERLPLEGVRIADLTVVWAGPYAAQILADWGAEVIRVEPLQIFQPVTRGFEAHPERGAFRSSHRFPQGEFGKRPWNRDNTFNVHARNKLSMTVDLRTEEGKGVFQRLIGVSDVVMENNPVGTLNKLGITYQWLRSLRPDIIVVRIPPYGLSGPYKDYRSVGSSLEAVIGHTYLRGYTDMDSSTTTSVYLADAVVGANAAFSTVSALYKRAVTGEGQLIEVPQAEAMLPYLGEALMDYSMNRRVQHTLGNGHPSRAPHGIYPCKGEDKWVAISIGSDENWKDLSQVMAKPGLDRDRRFSTYLGRYRHQEELNLLISHWTQEHEASQVMRMLQKRSIAAGVVQDEEELLRDAQLGHRGFFEELDHQDTGQYRYPGLMWKSQSHPNHLKLPPCLLGEHNPYVYKELLGYSVEEYRTLENLGHIGMEYPPHVP